MTRSGSGGRWTQVFAMGWVAAAAGLSLLAGCASTADGAAPELDQGGADSYMLIWGRPLQRKPGDGIVLDGPGGSATLTVTSQSGVGEALFHPTSGTWPRELRLEFRYAPDRPFTTLERLRLQTRANSFDSTADWPALELKDLPVRRSGAQFWFALPERWLADQQPLELEWVDRYR